MAIDISALLGGLATGMELKRNLAIQADEMGMRRQMQAAQLKQMMDALQTSAVNRFATMHPDQEIGMNAYGQPYAAGPSARLRLEQQRADEATKQLQSLLAGQALTQKQTKMEMTGTEADQVAFPAAFADFQKSPAPVKGDWAGPSGSYSSYITGSALTPPVAMQAEPSEVDKARLAWIGRGRDPQAFDAAVAKALYTLKNNQAVTDLKATQSELNQARALLTGTQNAGWGQVRPIDLFNAFSAASNRGVNVNLTPVNYPGYGPITVPTNPTRAPNFAPRGAAPAKPAKPSALDVDAQSLITVLNGDLSEKAVMNHYLAQTGRDMVKSGQGNSVAEKLSAILKKGKQGLSPYQQRVWDRAVALQKQGRGGSSGGGTLPADFKLKG